MSNIIQQLEKEWMSGKTIPEFSPGDTVVVQVKVALTHRSSFARSLRARVLNELSKPIRL